MNSSNLLEKYGSNTFNDKVMKECIPFETYQAYHEALTKGEALSKEHANIIAAAMKDWAISKGATHFTHWFTPLTGHTAEKHDSFLELNGDTPIFEFSGKLLRKGEPDASSFPSGGLRATFEARGYTAWDLTSHAFIKDHSLYIPTLFCSYTGESLDNKTQLLKSCDALNHAALDLLSVLGVNDCKTVKSYVGCEQEYFLVDEKYYDRRLDLKLTGRTLFGSNPPKGQELDDHYFGNINSRAALFMKELDHMLWEYGIPAKTKHNESAPNQHEIACIYRSVNTTTDNNHLLMQLMQDIAKKHGLRCLLHEKPFAGVNGSGKHNNWSVVTDTNINLFKPGENPMENIPFLASLACVIKGVDEYSDLLRLSIASASNDQRLGGNEAPPVIISMFLGDGINEVIDAIINGKKLSVKTKNRFKTGVSFISDFAKDNTDRNRTSPFAFTGNKFEFRGVGSSQSIANVNTMLNSILAIEFRKMTNEISSGKKAIDVIKEYLQNHKRIIFDGDGYSKEWQEEASRRGLSNKTNTVDAILALKDDRLTKPLIDLGVYSEVELKSRYEILLDTYSKTIQVEARTALKMAKNEIYPACIKYLNMISDAAVKLSGLYVENSFLITDVNEISKLLSNMQTKMNELEDSIKLAQKSKTDALSTSILWRDEVLTKMNELRFIADKLERKVDSSLWPIPTYIDLLFSF